MKSDSFGPFLDLPQKVGQLFELAVGGATAPRTLLADNGWKVQAPRPRLILGHIGITFSSRRRNSCVAKHGYVVSKSGWFSERERVVPGERPPCGDAGNRLPALAEGRRRRGAVQHPG